MLLGDWLSLRGGRLGGAEWASPGWATPPPPGLLWAPPPGPPLLQQLGALVHDVPHLQDAAHGQVVDDVVAEHAQLARVGAGQDALERQGVHHRRDAHGRHVLQQHLGGGVQNKYYPPKLAQTELRSRGLTLAKVRKHFQSFYKHDLAMKGQPVA